MSKNFAFMESINEDYYKLLCTIEKNTYIKPKDAARDCRGLLESFINEVLLEKNIKKKETLSDKLWQLSERNLLVNWDEMVKYNGMNNKGEIVPAELPKLIFVKNLGNASSHNDDISDIRENQVRVIISPEEVIKALEVFYNCFNTYFVEKKGLPIPKKFKKSNIPIGEYEIRVQNTPNDSERSKCIMEYRADRKLGEYSSGVKYALIREYSKNDLDDSLFLNRNKDVYSDAYSYIYDNGVGVKSINSIEEPYANYFMAYEFVKPVKSLSNFLKDNKLPLETRIEICKKIASALSKFHNAKNPIYHRMLTYESIVLSDFNKEGEGFVPYIIKFDFAKITSINVGTVYDNLSRADKTESLKLARYKIDDITPETKWDKKDIYSLGILFVDILMNGIQTTEVDEETFDKLEKMGISEEMLDIIDQMLLDNPNERPNINEVLEAIEKE